MKIGTAVFVLMVCTVLSRCASRPPEFTVTPTEVSTARRSIGTTPVPTLGADFEVYFEGLISFNFPSAPDLPRALLVKDLGSNPSHVPRLVLPVSLDPTDLKKANLDFDCSDGTVCIVYAAKKPFGFRIISEGTEAAPDPPSVTQPLDTEPFSSLVPHLSRLDRAFVMNGESKDQVPSQTTVVAYVELRGQSLGVAANYTCPARFTGEPNFHYFARQTQLTGHTAGKPVLQFKTQKDVWTTVHFAGTAPLHFQAWVVDLPVADMMSSGHFDLFKNISSASVSIPHVEVEPGCIVLSSLVPGCSNSQFP
jgi:hypothetical protein